MEGRLFGGHFEQISLLYGTPYWPNIEEPILFLEFTRYEPASLDARFYQMKQMGLFEQVRGVVIGHLTNAPPEKEYQAEEILREVTSRSDFPIL